MRIEGRLLGDIFEGEVPSGTVNGSNVTFTLSSTPHSVKAVMLFQDGLRLRYTTHYTISGATITMAVAPILGQVLWADYIKRT